MEHLAELQQALRERGLWTDAHEVVNKEILKQSDRAAAILAATMLESRIADVIKSTFKRNDKLTERLFESEDSLTFSARIGLGYALGFYGPKTHRDLTLIRKIRNLFAHRMALADSTKSISEATFDSPEIASRCDELETIRAFSKKKGGHPRRASFVFSAEMIFVGLSLKLVGQMKWSLP
jgi:hypothetical protein